MIKGCQMIHSGRLRRNGFSRNESVLLIAAFGVITLMAVDLLSRPVQTDVARFALTPAQASMDRIEAELDERDLGVDAPSSEEAL